jgi:hypothetical protein
MLVGAAVAVPVDPPEVPRYIAANRVDSDANPGFTSNCVFLGVAARTTDVYSCTAGYPADVTLRLEHERGTTMYRATVLTDTLDYPGASLVLNDTQWCTERSEVICDTELNRQLFPRAYGTLVPGNIGCHWIDYRVHRLDPPCDSAIARDLGGPYGSWPPWP